MSRRFSLLLLCQLWSWVFVVSLTHQQSLTKGYPRFAMDTFLQTRDRQDDDDDDDDGSYGGNYDYGSTDGEGSYYAEVEPDSIETEHPTFSPTLYPTSSPKTMPPTSPPTAYPTSSPTIATYSPTTPAKTLPPTSPPTVYATSSPTIVTYSPTTPAKTLPPTSLPTLVPSIQLAASATNSPSTLLTSQPTSPSTLLTSPHSGFIISDDRTLAPSPTTHYSSSIDSSISIYTYFFYAVIFVVVVAILINCCCCPRSSEVMYTRVHVPSDEDEESHGGAFELSNR